MSNSHAQTVMQTMYDGEVGAGYIKFCDCKSGKTKDVTADTNHALLYDLDTTGNHVIGLEILNFPSNGFQQGSLAADLNITSLTDEQKESILARFFKNS